MENNLVKKRVRRSKRAIRNRSHLRGNASRPRLCVVKTNAHIHVQLIDDENGVTLASISTLNAEFRAGEFNRRNVASAKQIGLKIAALASEKKVSEAIFDRGPFKYHGVIAAVANGAREGGLKV